MIPRRAALTVVAVVALSALPAAALAASRAAAPCAADTGAQVATSASYRFVLRIGGPEKMYTPAQVKSLHPKTGEVMIGGGTAMSGMAMGSSNATRHLEVQICARKTDELITDARPTITLSDSMGMATHVQAATMRGVNAGAGDIHYGSNVKLPAGQKLTVAITLKGEKVAFTVQLPRHS